MTKEIRSEEFREQIDKIIHTCVLNDKYIRKLNFSKIKLSSTGLKNTSHKPPDASQITLNDSFRRAINTVFRKAFTMYEAGKNKEAIFKTLYACPEKSLQEKYKYLENQNFLEYEKELLPINVNEKTCKNFVIELRNRSDTIKNNTNAIDACKRSRFFLIGDVGIGKTTFLNYIFSTYHNDLRISKVIWIRVDLTKKIYSEMSLFDALKFKIAHTYRGYYEDDFRKNFDSFERKLADSFRISNPNISFNQNEFQNNFNNYLRPFNKAQEKPYDERIQDGIKSYVEDNYSTIYIFDGLDKLDNNDESFKKKLKDLITILTSEKFKGIYIFVMRLESHFDFIEEYFVEREKYHLSSLRGYGKTFTLLPVKLKDIVDRRLNLIGERLNELVNNEKREILNIKSEIYIDNEIIEENFKPVLERLSKFGINANVLKAYFRVFLQYLFRGVILDESDLEKPEWNERETYSELKNLIGTNLRRLLNILTDVQRCFLETLEILNMDADKIAEIYISDEQKNLDFKNYKEILNKILTKYYRIFQVLIRGDSSYIHPYYYEYNNDNLIKRKRTESPYIYNLYYSINAVNVENEHYNLLLKIRILQLIKKHEENKNFKEKDIPEYLSKIFPYQEYKIKMAVDELKLWDYIVNSPIVVQSGIDHFIETTRIGNNFLNKLHKDFHYLRLILDDMIVPSDIMDDFLDKFPDKYLEDKSEWILLQIPRVANFITLIYNVELNEKKNFKGENFGDWEITTQIYQSFIYKITPILLSHDRELKWLKKTFAI